LGRARAKALVLGQQRVVVVDTLLRDTGSGQHANGLTDHLGRPGHIGLTGAVWQVASRDAADVSLHSVERRVI
jgi:hypothetical protein